MIVEFLKNHAAAIFSAASPFIIWLLNFTLQPKAKLFQQTRHRFTYLINQPLLDASGKVISPTQVINTASISVFNAGRSPATKVEIVYNWKPQHLNIWPSRHFEEKLSPDGRYHMFFENLPAKDIMGFELLNINQDLPAMITVRSEQCVATLMELQPQPVFAKWKIFTLRFFIGVGFAFTVYLAILLLQFLVAR